MKKFTLDLNGFSYDINEVEVTSYHNNNSTALILHTEEGDIVASINPDQPLSKEMVAIKNYSENVGIEEGLIKAGIIEPEVLTTIQLGFVEVPVYLLAI